MQCCGFQIYRAQCVMTSYTVTEPDLRTLKLANPLVMILLLLFLQKQSLVDSRRWIAMGSKSSSIATSFDVLAFIPASRLELSESLSEAYGPINGVYWYYKKRYSVGFASSMLISLGHGDSENVDCTWRLSWIISEPLLMGGFRSGCNIDLFGNLGPITWRKLMYSCHCSKRYCIDSLC
jgi:hypothetical protein